MGIFGQDKKIEETEEEGISVEDACFDFTDDDKYAEHHIPDEAEGTSTLEYIEFLVGKGYEPILTYGDSILFKKVLQDVEVSVKKPIDY